jgi:pimeloyl-ACP methyl ester carboxylesterase
MCSWRTSDDGPAGTGRQTDLRLTGSRVCNQTFASGVLAIGGSDSAGLNPARAIAQSAPVVGEVIAEGAHFVPEEQPERTPEVLLEELSAANL